MHCDLCDRLARRKVPLVYFVRVGDFVKIGTTVNLKSRMRTLQTHCWQPIHIIGVRVGGRDEERRVHSKFAKDRTHLEWFRYSYKLSKEASVKSLLQ